jgi:hypothetical protein
MVLRKSLGGIVPLLHANMGVHMIGLLVSTTVVEKIHQDVHFAE